MQTKNKKNVQTNKIYELRPLRIKTDLLSFELH